MSAGQSGSKIFKNHKKITVGLFCLIATFLIGDVDYLTGYQISLLVFYILPVGFATIYVGPLFAIALAVLSVLVSICTDYWAGMPYADTPILIWNTSLVLSVFFIVIGLLHGLYRIMVRLESSVQQKNRALLNEMSERGRLEREIIDLSEHEQRRFGQELHDVVCQELASVGIAAHMLERKLALIKHEETAHAGEIARMADHALETTRTVARGFFTAGFDGAGLEEALREGARQTEKRSGISCVVRWQENLAITDEATVIHSFRVAQEAIQNAVKHANATQIKVSMERTGEKLRLMVEDNGKGLDMAKGEKGLGLRIMAYRAGLIGGEFTMEHTAAGGIRIVCLIPAERSKQPMTNTA